MNSTGPTFWRLFFFYFTAFPQLQDQDIRPDTFKFLAVLNIEATRQQTNGPQTPVEHLCCEGSQTEGRGRSRGLRSPFVVINCWYRAVENPIMRYKYALFCGWSTRSCDQSWISLYNYHLLLLLDYTMPLFGVHVGAVRFFLMAGKKAALKTSDKKPTADNRSCKFPVDSS